MNFNYERPRWLSGPELQGTGRHLADPGDEGHAGAESVAPQARRLAGESSSGGVSPDVPGCAGCIRGDSADSLRLRITEAYCDEDRDGQHAPLPLVAAGYLHDESKHYTPFDDGNAAFSSTAGDNGASPPLTSDGTGLRGSVPSFIDRHITAVFVAIVLGGVGVWILWILRVVQG